MEQFIRSYALEPLDIFKVCSKSEFFKIPILIKQILNNSTFPNKHEINLEGVKNSANVIKEIYN